MIGNLKIRHLAAYADKKCFYQNKEQRIVPFSFKDLCDINDNEDAGIAWQENYKLVLYPLSDLTKKITYNGYSFVPIKKIGLSEESICNGKLINVATGRKINYNDLEYQRVIMLTEWRFDIFELIDKGLAIDVNTSRKKLYK
ncbi:hypothetical protein D1816_11195 [Aquimarina sp. AD10]|uniref:Uncharacterized protein n=1 Tax=Aquimarina aggregata TaxID=1642818 RepID=A0A162Y9B1_9FLAO|nr:MULTISPECIES: hypothetical protein [Aquimarina]AXT60887.1 hypothetical protein D1816_11195 [Aquimarina sp. AD10]KZS38998.1 hypothetical protein AWE51_10550 [Aquimarina aggregata]RKM93036.1 hypothetical protein D7033_20250 [Aquimarina sp. AD10]